MLRALAASPLALALLAGAAHAQWRPPDRTEGLRPRAVRRGPAAEPAAESAPGTHLFDVSCNLGAWWWFSHFRADTAAERFEITGPTTFDARLAVSVPVWRQVELDLAPEYALGAGTTTWVVALGAALRLDLFDEWWFMSAGRLRTRLAFCVGGFDWSKVPGSFDTGIGAEFGAEFAFGLGFLPAAMQVTAGVDLRSLTFEFNPDAEVLETDSAYGGFGMIVRFGVRYAF